MGEFLTASLPKLLDRAWYLLGENNNPSSRAFRDIVSSREIALWKKLEDLLIKYPDAQQGFRSWVNQNGWIFQDDFEQFPEDNTDVLAYSNFDARRSMITRYPELAPLKGIAERLPKPLSTPKLSSNV